MGRSARALRRRHGERHREVRVGDLLPQEMEQFSKSRCFAQSVIASDPGLEAHSGHLRYRYEQFLVRFKEIEVRKLLPKDAQTLSPIYRSSDRAVPHL